MLRIHVRMGTLMLPDRPITEQTVTHDVIDVDGVSPHEQVMQCELEPAITSFPPVTGRRMKASDIGIGRSKQWRYRLVSVEQSEYIRGEGEAEGLPAPRVSDAELVEELTDNAREHTRRQ